MDHKSRVRWMTRTAIFMALLIVLQAATAPLGNILITGSAVNLLLIISVMTCGLASGLTVAAISPIMAKFLGIGPLWSIIPFVAAGNAALVFLWHVIGDRNTGRRYTASVAALVCAAVAKFLILYVGIVKIALPVFLGLPEQQAAVVSNMFSIPQLFTALIGGALATVLFPRLKKAMLGGNE